MLDKTSRKFLTLITTSEPNMSDHLFTFDYVGEKLGMSKAEVFACIRYLDSNDLIHCAYVEYPPNSGKKSLWGFEASHKGRHFAEFSVLDLLKTILESVLLPIVVSIITALIVSA